MECDHDDDLFIRPDGKPMVFIIGSNRVESQKIKSLIETGGGVVVDQNNVHNNPMVKDHGIMLIIVKEIPLKKDTDRDMFVTKYILDCVTENKIIEQMSDYRFRSHLPSIYREYDPLDILLGTMTWSQLNRRDGPGAKVSDIEDDDDVSLIQGPSRLKTYKSTYSQSEQQCIVDWIVKNKAYKNVKGNIVWQQMESQGVVSGRTWQSVKEHFRKQIIPQIHTYRGLTWRQIRRFRSVFGMDQEPVDFTTSEEDEVEDFPVSPVPSRRRRKKSYNILSIVDRNLLEEENKEDENIEGSSTGTYRKFNKTSYIVPSDNKIHSNKNIPNYNPAKLINGECKTTSKTLKDCVEINNFDVPCEGDQIIDVVLDVRDDSELSKMKQKKAGTEKMASGKKRRLFKKKKGLLNVDIESPGLSGPSPVSKKLRHELFDINQGEEDKSNSENPPEFLTNGQIFATSDQRDTLDALQEKVNIPSGVVGSNVRGNIIDNVPANTEEFETGLKEMCIISEEPGFVTSTQREENSVVTKANEADGQVIKEVSSTFSESRNLLQDNYSDNCDGPPKEPLDRELENSNEIGSHNVEPDDNNLNIGRIESSSYVNRRSQSPPKKKFKAKRSSQNIDPAIGSFKKKSISLKSTPENFSFSPVISNEFYKSPSKKSESDSSVASVPEQKTYKNQKYSSFKESKPNSSTKAKVKYKKIKKAKVNIRKLSGVELVMSMLKNSPPCCCCPKISTYSGSPRSRSFSVSRGLVNIPKDQVCSGKCDQSTKTIDNNSDDLIKQKEDNESSINISSTFTVSLESNNSSSTDSEVPPNNILQQEANQSDEINQPDDVNLMVRENIPKPGSSKDVKTTSDERPRPRKNSKNNSEDRRNVVIQNPRGNDDHSSVEHISLNTSYHPEDNKFKEKWRTQYTKEEDTLMINYLFLHGGYGISGGNLLWKQMENSGACPGRTWQSLRERFNKHLNKRLRDFQVTKAMLVNADEKVKLHAKIDKESITEQTEQEINISTLDSSTGVTVKQNNQHDLPINNTLFNGKRPYLIAEDLNILHFIGDNKRFGDTRGREMWETMEKRNVVPGRSWQSMKERYRKTILRNLSQPNHYPDISQMDRSFFLKKS